MIRNMLQENSVQAVDLEDFKSAVFLAATDALWLPPRTAKTIKRRVKSLQAQFPELLIGEGLIGGTSGRYFGQWKFSRKGRAPGSQTFQGSRSVVPLTVRYSHPIAWSASGPVFYRPFCMLQTPRGKRRQLQSSFILKLPNAAIDPWSSIPRSARPLPSRSKSNVLSSMNQQIRSFGPVNRKRRPSGSTFRKIVNWDSTLEL